MILWLSLIIAISTHFYCYLNYSPETDKLLSSMLLLIFIFLFIIKSNTIRNANYSKEVTALMILPFVSAIPCYIYRGQDIFTTIIATRTEVLWLFYFILHKYRVPQKAIVKSLLIAGFIAVSINVLQEFLYPSFYLFDVKNADDEIEIRNGFYRFRLFENNYYEYFCLFYFISAYIACKAKKYLPLILLFVIGVYFTLTRQIWVSIFLSVILFPFISNNKMGTQKLFYLLVSFVVIYIVSINLEVIFGKDLLNNTTDSLNSDDIRKQAMFFYGITYWEDAINVFFGNGFPSIGNSDYGNATKYFQETLGLWRSDIGIVGTFSYYGVIYILAVIMLYKKIFKNFKKFSPYSKMLMVASVINLPLAAWLLPIFMSFLLYLQDLEIEKYNLRKIQKY